MRTLLVPDKFWGGGSGPTASRTAYRLLSQAGCETAVYADNQGKTAEQTYSGQSYLVYPRTSFKGVHHLKAWDDEFQSVLESFQPTHVFLLGMAYNKPISWYKMLRRRSISVIQFWWQQDFFCVNGYACLPSGPCEQCISEPSAAIVKRCGSAGTSPLVGLVKRVYQSVVISAIRRHMIGCVVMGTGSTQAGYYARLGVGEDMQVQCPLFFDLGRVGNYQASLGHYLVMYGSARYEKGWHMLDQVLSRCSPSVEIVVPCINLEEERKLVAEFSLGRHIASGQVKLARGLTWGKGLEELVAHSRGILIPSVWPTTTEYVLLEGLGYGKPVITWDVGVHNELIAMHDAGFSCRLGDYAQMAEAMHRLVTEDALYEQMSQSAGALFRKMTDEAQICAALALALAKAVK